MEIKLHNTATRKLEKFVPQVTNELKMYNCGPTVYDYAHIGNLRAFTMADIIRRIFEYNGYDVKQVMNITDVGHLVSDADAGEDKMEQGAKREGKNPLDIANFYTKHFLEDSKQMNFLEPLARPRASEFINEMLEMIKILVDEGYAYITKSAVYFNVEKFPEYGKLTGQNLADKKVGVREEVVDDPDKINPFDFRLWQLDQPNHILKWPSPWGEGFPGWHIECSAMAKAYLGDTLDIHTGGIDHIPVHHTNEIAQSEAANGKKFVNYWYHNEFILVDGVKMSKSKNNFYNLSDIVVKGYTGLDLRYLFFTVHFRQMQNFTWQALAASKSALQKLKREVTTLKSLQTGKGKLSQVWKNKFLEAVNDDFNMPEALAIVWELSKSDLNPDDKLTTLLDFDKVLGLNLDIIDVAKLSTEDNLAVENLVKERQVARENKDWKEADRIRELLMDKYKVEIKDEGEKAIWSIKI